MTRSLLPGSTLADDVADPVTASRSTAIYIDPNGLTVNVPTKPGHHRSTRT